MGGFCSTCETRSVCKTSFRSWRSEVITSASKNPVNGTKFWEGLTYTQSYPRKISHVSNKRGVGAPPTLRTQLRVKVEPRKAEPELKPIPSVLIKTVSVS